MKHCVAIRDENGDYQSMRIVFIGTPNALGMTVQS